MCKDEQKGYFQVLLSNTHRKLFSMLLPTGEHACWLRAAMGNKLSSDSFLTHLCGRNSCCLSGQGGGEKGGPEHIHEDGDVGCIFHPQPPEDAR
jgi:hypothetical protein